MCNSTKIHVNMHVDIYCIIVYFQLMILYQLSSNDKKNPKTILTYLLCTFLIAPTQDIWITWIKMFQLSNYIK